MAEDVDHLTIAVEATLARMAALSEADEQLELRRQALRGMHYEQGLPRGEVFRLLNNALRERGLTDEQLKDAGVAYDSIVKILRKP